MERKQEIGNNRTKYIMLESLVAALAVVTLHTNGCFWRFGGSDTYWPSANVIECVFYFAVPVFFMISGATNLDYFDKYSTGQFFWKRIKKTVIPYVVWSLLGVLYLVILKKVNPQDVTIKYLIKGLSQFNLINLYWFFGPLFLAYLCMPLFAAVQKDRKSSVFSLMVILSFLFNLLFPFIIYHIKVNYAFPLSITVGTGYLIFLMLGYLLDKNEIKLPVRIAIYVFSIIGLLIHLLGTYKLSIAAGEIIKTYKGYITVPTILYSSGIFVFIKQVGNKIKSERFWKVVGFLNKYTFSLYLMQWFFLYYVENFTKIDTTSMTYRLCGPFVIFAIVIIITYIVRKIPVVKWIVP